MTRQTLSPRRMRKSLDRGGDQTAPRLGKSAAGRADTALTLNFAASFMDVEGLIDFDRVADEFRMSRAHFAETAGLSLASVTKSDRRHSQRSQARVGEMLEIIGRIRQWAGGEAQALAWFRSQPIPALDGRTAEALVKAGQAGAVRDYLDHLALGGFA